MATNRQLKINLLKDQNDFSLLVKSILLELNKIDNNSFLLPLEKAIASRALNKTLWDFLPDESESFQFSGIDEQMIKGKEMLPTTDLKQIITLHLGWDTLSFSCSLEAAWFAWINFKSLNTDTFNCCIYPENLDWYIIRAGSNLYPMNFRNDKYELIK